MDDKFTDDLWAEYASLQERSDKIQKLGQTAWAIEDQLNSFLESFAKGVLPASQEEREKQRTNLLINRQKKYRNRAKLLQKLAATFSTSSPPNLLILRLMQSQQLHKVFMLATKQDMRILWSLALDVDYKTVAQREGMNVIALKTKVHRCRQQLRKRLQGN